MQSAVVRTGGIKFGIRMARPKCFAVYGSTALSISPSRTCRCQSSGLRMVMRVVMAALADRRCGRRIRLHRRLVDHGAGKISHALEAALGAPLFEAVDDRNHAAR